LENLLTWSRTQRKKIIPEPIKLKVFDVIDQSIQILQGRMKSKEITLESDIDKNLTVFFDNNMIHAVVRNILTNAVKFTRRKGKIKILAEEAGPNTTIRFSDDGIGMSKEKLASLFLIDKTVSVVGTEGETGTGLGLILSNEFVLANNGTLKIESEENEGTTVILTVPSK
jgi:signal transduction histidine kinase